MEPRDLHVTQMNMLVNPRYGQGISSHRPNGANVVFADMSVRSVWNDTDPQLMRDMISRHDENKNSVREWR